MTYCSLLMVMPNTFLQNNVDISTFIKNIFNNFQSSCHYLLQTLLKTTIVQVDKFKSNPCFIVESFHMSKLAH